MRPEKDNENMLIYQAHRETETDTYRLGEQIDTAIARLITQDRLLVGQMGGLFPERENNFDGFTRVLDVASGSGFWAAQVARAYPRIEVIGMPSHRKLVNYASGLAEAMEIDNACFTLLAETNRLPFPDDYFDMINAHFLFSLLHVEEWPVFIGECLRVTRPGGYLRFIEPEWGMTNSQAFEELGSLYLQGLKQMGHSFSPGGRHIGVLPMLGYFLQQAGAMEITRRVYANDYSCIEPQRPSSPALRMALLDQLFRPLLLNQRLVSQEKYEQLLQQATEEVGREDFCEISFFLSTCGRKPETI